MAKDRVIVGIDIGSSKVCTLISTATPEGGVNIIGAATTESQGIRKSQVVDIEEAIEGITKSVEAAERMAGYSVSSVFVSVGGAHIFCENSHGVVAVAEPEGEITYEDVQRVIEAARAISLPAAREIIHVLPRFFIVDSQGGIKDPIGMTGVRLEVETHIISGAATTMKNLVKCISEIGIDVEGLVFSGLASSEAVLSETEKELGVLLVDIGGGTTSLSAFVEGSLAHSAVIPLGARNITADLAIGLRVSLESAEKIKLFLSESPKKMVKAKGDEEKQKKEEKEQKEKKDDEIDLAPLQLHEELRTVSRKTLTEGIIRPRLNEIFSYVENEIKKAELAGLTPAGVVLTGGGAQTAGIVEAGKRSLAMPVRVGAPKGLTGLIDEVKTPDFATSCGLLFYGAKQEKVGRVRGLRARLPFGGEKLKGLAGKIVNLIKSLIP